ncbi:DUF3221 domain-containing protein [Alkalicoccobacillus porphyridii]|uniref:DUF3221 domain-containing protein n=1 Tax=Alkalicoccobacillus porphyridii TaxID=2597270 RepID=A0A553ZUF2_9BACI|nr:DUF3221 domain-containing protein [Alkalicoccobacillus porphyridii]TSB45077.1 DUF3221 domain-containing protein [Alkalicoccobacillus porphyridii]
MEGIVAIINGDQILLVEGLTSEGTKGLTEEELIDESHGAAYLVLTEGNEDVTVGDEVKVWIEALNTSHPAFGDASKVEVLP